MVNILNKLELCIIITHIYNKFGSYSYLSLFFISFLYRQTDRLTDMAISTGLLMPIKNTYCKWGLPILLLPVTCIFRSNNVTITLFNTLPPYGYRV